jgi:hypothetical protein
MTDQRWTDLGKQLVDLGVIPTAAPPAECYLKLEK